MTNARTTTGALLQTDIDSLIAFNASYSQEFLSLESERARYRGEHPTEVAALKCMDGRLNLAVMTQSTMGLISPFRNLGGKFSLGWPHFQSTVHEWIKYSQGRGRHCLVLVTYHFSIGDKHRGCAGFNYDTQAAKDAAIELRSQFKRLYGMTAVYPAVVGIETDKEAFVLVGEGGDEVDLSKVSDDDESALKRMIMKLYPNMAERVATDFVPIVQGNVRHAKEVSSQYKQIADTEHKEKMLVVGRGVDYWLHSINIAFNVGPFDPDMKNSVMKGATLLAKNVEEGRVSADNLMLLTSAPYREYGVDQKQAEMRAMWYKEMALSIIREHVPQLIHKYGIQVLVTTLNMQNRRIDVLDRVDDARSLFRQEEMATA